MKEGRRKGFRLLGVEPSPSLRAFVEQLCEDCRIEAVLCATLAEARRHLAEHPFDLVLTSGELADGNHLDVLAVVREQPSMALTPVLLLTAGRNDHTVKEALDSGITEVFSKQSVDDLARYLESFSASRGARHTGGLQALVVEDERSLATYCKEFLTDLGLEVDLVPSGEAALWEARQRQYDFILVDLVLSGACSGTQFLRRLRQDGELSAHAVAVAMSAYGDEARRIEALRAGANAFIAKPINEDELAALVAGMIAQRQPSPSGRKKKTAADTQGTACVRCQPCQLTPRESNICGLVAAGYSDKRIAEEMGVSYWTVRTHIAHAFKKCEVSNRVELVRRLQGN